MTHYLREALWWTSLFSVSLLALQSLVYLAQLIFASIELRRHLLRQKQVEPWWLLTSNVTLPISLLVPAFNEEKSIVENIHSLLGLNYPEFEVIVINDGSKDNTLMAAVTALGLERVDRVYHLAVQHKTIRGLYGSPKYPQLLVIDKENGGKSDALNAGINLSRYPLFCAVDADSILDSNALLQVVRPYVEEPDLMIAVGGRIRLANGCKVRNGQIVEFGLPTNSVALMQVVEYIRAFLMARLAWSRMNAMLIISGAFGVFKRTATIQVGGYSHGTVGEDMDLVVKLHRYYRERNIPYTMRYVPDPVCWTEAPESLAILRRQRTRWQRGTLECLRNHKKMIFSPKYGAVGILGMGYYFLFDVIGPIVEVAGYILIPLCWLIGILSLKFFLAYLALLAAFGIFLSVSSLLLEELSLEETPSARGLLSLTGAAILENFGYRQLNNLWRIEGIWQFLRKKTGWGTMTRAGFSSAQKK
ncbi:MAG TPA: glycosyltransferase [Methylomirabilota bacterium]|nr:glycosyltransferase [Methylomirabilota bacterium]